MADAIVETIWKASLKHEGPRDRFDRKFAQAEALTHTVKSDDFFNFNNSIQADVLWLLGDLLTEAREALEESERQA